MRFSFDRSRTTRRRTRFGVAACACLLGASLLLRTGAAETSEVEPPSPASAESVLGSLQSRYEHITDLRANFVQDAHLASLGKHDVSRGRLVMQRPGRMRWEYLAPEARVIVLERGILRVYTPSESQLQIATATGGAVSPTALGFLLGEGDLRTEFTSERIEAEGRDEIGVRLRPRGDAAFEHIEIWLEPNSHQLRESVVVDVFGNRTSLRFTEMTENTGVDDDAFEIRVPEDTEVIDLR